MAYQILARKYRPQKFTDLTGQATTAKILKSALSTGKIAPAYLFSGPRGTGKTTTARIFSKALNCQNRHEFKKTNKDDSRLTTAFLEPCNSCTSCQEITSGSSLDVLEMDAASHTQVDNIREVVINTVAFAPVRDQYKIFIIDEVHMLSNHSFNALLKTLEEPPAHVVFILCTTEFHKIPATISSRCQRFRFLPLPQKEIFTFLKKVAAKENIPVEDDALTLLSKSASGSMRDALSLFDQVISHCPDLSKAEEGDLLEMDSFTSPKKAADSSIIGVKKVEEILGVVREDVLMHFMHKVAERDSKGVLECIGKIIKEGYDLSYFLKEVRECFREMLIEKCGYKDADSFTRLKTSLPVNQFSLEQLLRDIQILSKCADQMRWNDFPRMIFECYAVRLCQKTIGVEEIMTKLEAFEKGKVDWQKDEPSHTKQEIPNEQPKSSDHLPTEHLKGGVLHVRSDDSVGAFRILRASERPEGSVPEGKDESAFSTPPECFVPSGTVPSAKQSPSDTFATLSADSRASGVQRENEEREVTCLKENPSSPLPPNIQDESAETILNLKQTWSKLLINIQESNPSLYRTLEMASVQFSSEKIELTFTKSFWMDNVKRNLILLGTLLNKLLNKKVALALKLGEMKGNNADEEESDVMDTPIESTTEITEESKPNDQNDEVFEMVDDSQSSGKDLVVEDEGLKKFLNSFSGKLTKLPTNTT